MDPVVEEDGLKTQLVAGDAGGEGVPPRLVQRPGFRNLVTPEDEVVLIEAGVSGEPFILPFPIQAEGSLGVDLVLQVAVPKFLIYTVPVGMLHLREGDAGGDALIREAVKLHPRDAEVRVHVDAVVVLRQNLVGKDLREAGAHDRIRALIRNLPQLPHAVLSVRIREANVIPVRRHGDGLFQAVVTAGQTGEYDFAVHRRGSLTWSPSSFRNSGV